jgi:hemolysin III
MIKAKLQELSVEEVANSLTHGAGLLLSIGGFGFLVALAIIRGDVWHVTSSVVYGASLVTLYAASTFYHTTTRPDLKRRLQMLDHCCIYLLIAGSYTPFALIVLRESIGFSLLAIVWAAAVFGMSMKLIFPGRFSAGAIVLYLTMGWIGVIAVQPLYLALGAAPLILVVAGGLSYTLGMIFFGWHGIRHHHAIFHVFVLAGSIMHYLAIALYVFA